MKNGFLGILLLIFLLPASLGAVNPTELETQIEKIRREREVLVEEQKKLQAELEAVNREAATLGGAVKSLDTTRRKLVADINITNSKINTTNLSIQSLANTMTEKEEQIVTHRLAIRETLLALREYDSKPLILSVLASAKLSDLWGDRGRLDKLNVDLQTEIDDLRETKKVLSQEKEKKEKARLEQLSLQRELSGQKSVVEENKKAKERLLLETKSKEAEYQKLLAENRKNQQQFESDLYRLESELRLTIDPNSYPLPKNGILSWPLDSVTVTQKFGDTDFSRSGAYRGNGHNGIDFRATQGTALKAVLAGTVEGTGNTDEMNAQLRREGKSTCGSYGRWVLIRHSNGLTSVYAHMSATIVKTGQSVATGETIGYSGGQPGVNGSGYSTGPHLHLGLFASQGVQIRQFSSSLNCKHTIVPIADLRAYLDPLAYLPSL